MGVRRILVLVALSGTFWAALPAGAAQAKACGDIRVDRSYYIVGGAKAPCDFMRRWSRSLIKRNGGPREWDCHRRARSGGCTRHTGARIEPFFVYYPPD